MGNNSSFDPYAHKTVKKNRTFPVSKTVGLVVLLAIQILAITLAVLYVPTPQDRIERYELIAEPRPDGSVDLEYRFVWTALDESEDLTWIEIGMANENFEVYMDSLSPEIASCKKHVDGDYVSLQLYLKQPCKGGQTLQFSFRICQRDLLCRKDGGYFYAFVPGWFNATPVESYCFTWKDIPGTLSANTSSRKDGYYIWEGSMPCGTYVPMQVRYEASAFTAPATVKYEKFDDGDVNDDLEGDRIGVIILAVILCLSLLAVQIYMVDSVVSYHRGRGFLTGYGHRVHVYGRTNPRYRAAQIRHSASSGRSGGRSGGGCACACACACAGGGRAGCSQKDTYEVKQKNPQ